MPIENVSDTARWVAVYRAMESARPDALFHDRFASRLAGDRGTEIVDELRRGRSLAAPMIVRTVVFDEIILDCIAKGADLVVNLAAGLDARPWRMRLPPSLRWVDVDLPGILNYKTAVMRDEQPVCQYEAVVADLTNAEERSELFARLGVGSGTALVVTEGLLVYLTAEQVGALARAIHSMRNARWWLTDLANPRLLKLMNRHWGKSAQAGNAPFLFAPPDGPAFFEPFGWREVMFRSGMDEARRLGREMRGMWLWRLLSKFASAEKREDFRRMSASVLLEGIEAGARS